MKNNLKKIGIIGACLVAMIGSGACEYIASGITYTQNMKDNIFIKETTKKIKNNTANDTDYLLYAFMLASTSPVVRKQLEIDSISQQDIHELYKENMQKSMNLGNITAKIKYANILFSEATQEKNENLQHEKLLQALETFENVILNQCTSGDLWVIYPNFHQYQQRKNVQDLITNHEYWVQDIFTQDSKNFNKFPDIIQKAQLIMLYEMEHCHPTSIGVSKPNFPSDEMITFYYTAEKILQRPSISYYPLKGIAQDREIRLKIEAEKLYLIYRNKYPLDKYPINQTK